MGIEDLLIHKVDDMVSLRMQADEEELFGTNEYQMDRTPFISGFDFLART